MAPLALISIVKVAELTTGEPAVGANMVDAGTYEIVSTRLPARWFGENDWWLVGTRLGYACPGTAD